MGDLRDIKRSANIAAKSAAASARSNAATASATQRAATGVWVGAGFQAASAFQAARAARAQQEQLELQYAMAEQEQLHQFAMWRQTPDGIAFVQWRVRAVRLAQFIRNRDSVWVQGWTRAIGRAQAETSDGEKLRLVRHPARLKQQGLRVTAIIVSIFVGLLALIWLPSIISLFSQMTAQLFNPEGYLLDGIGYGSTTDSVRLRSALILWFLLVVTGVPVAATVLLWWQFRKRQRAAREDPTVLNEARDRFERWGFDPLTVSPGYVGLPWDTSQAFDGYADQLMELALRGHTLLPAQSQLIRLGIPVSLQPHPKHPVEVNEVLAWFQQEERPVIS